MEVKQTEFSRRPEHKLILTARKSVSVNGVSEVIATSSEVISVTISGGEGLMIFGKNLNIKKLVLTEGLLEAEGEVAEVKYAVEREKKSFMKRVFK